MKTENPQRRPEATKLLQTLDGDGVAFRLSGKRHYLTVTLRRDLVLVRNLEDLAFLGHQNDLVAVANAPGNALGVDPHPLAPLGAGQIDDVTGQASTGSHAARSRRDCGSRSASAATSTSSSTAAGRLEHR